MRQTAEGGVWRLQHKACWGSPGNHQTQEDSRETSSPGLRGSTAWQHLDSGRLAFRTGRPWVSVVWSHPFKVAVGNQSNRQLLLVGSESTAYATNIRQMLQEGICFCMALLNIFTHTWYLHMCGVYLFMCLNNRSSIYHTINFVLFGRDHMACVLPVLCLLHWQIRVSTGPVTTAAWQQQCLFLNGLYTHFLVHHVLSWLRWVLTRFPLCVDQSIKFFKKLELWVKAVI